MPPSSPANPVVDGGKTAAYGEALLVVERNAESCSGGENHIGLLLTAERLFTVIQ
jgi:hypothetical protein